MRVWPDAPLAAPRPSLWVRVYRAVIGEEPSTEPAAAPLQRPFAVATGPGGDLIVADPDGPLVARVPIRGPMQRIECPLEPWAAPMAVQALPDGSIVVADAGAAQVVWIGRDGRCDVLGRDALERPTGIAVAGDRLYVADPPRHEVAVLDRHGSLVAHLGTRGEGDGQLAFPSSVAVAGDGTILVVDALNFRIARFSADGTWLGAFGRPGDAGPAFARPKCLAVGPDGRIYVSDAQRDVVLVFRPDGAFDYAIGESGSAPGRFAHPAGVSVTGTRLLVADSQNARVQVFELIQGGAS